MKNKWFAVIGIILFLGFFSIMSAGIIGVFMIASDAEVSDGNVALIPVKGPIYIEESTGFYSESVASSTRIVRDIEDAVEDSSIEAIVLEINSPGGAPVATDEIATAIKLSDKPVVAWIREVGASGAFYIAASSDYIIAHPMTIAGSIGVIGSYLEFDGLMNDYNVSYRRLVAGEYKDMGSPYREMSAEEEAKYQEILDSIHDQFIGVVAEGRGLTREETEKIATGEVFLGTKAYELNLVDELGGKYALVSYLEKELNTTISFHEYTYTKSFLESLSGMISSHGFFMGKGIGTNLEVKNQYPII